MNIYIITHTHWDREWYRTFEEFRIYLVDLLDNLLDFLLKDNSYHSFLLDGQVVLLEDYLQVRPERKAELQKMIRAGKIIIGPLYTQPDEFIPDAESLVRNFLIGSLICENFARKLQVGYFPDSFGQASQIPQILNGFGIDKAVFWRGLCDKQLKKTEFIWQSSEGSKVTAVWMPFSYGNAYTMPADKQGALDFINNTIDTLGKMGTTSNILLMRGWDHSGFSPEIVHVLQSIHQDISVHGNEILHSSLESYFDAVGKESPVLPVLVGEFREPKTMRIHPGIDSTRMDIKQLNRRCQSLLEKNIEPVCSMNWLMGCPYPKPVINQAWKYILQSQAHDSICGCCTDQAMKGVRNRFNNALEIEEPLLNRAISEYAAFFETDQQPGIPVLVFNSLPYTRTEIAEVEAVIPFAEFNICDKDGNSIPSQIISSEKVQLGIDPSVEAMHVAGGEGKKDLLKDVGRRPDDPAIYYSNDDYVPLAPRAKGIEGHRVVFRFPVSEIGGCSNHIVYLRKSEKKGQDSIESGVRTGENFLENEFLRVDIHQNGSLDLYEKQDGVIHRNIHIFEDAGDAGDTYNYSPPFNDTVLTSANAKAKLTTFEVGPLSGSILIDLEFEVPVGLSQDGKYRSNDTEVLKISSMVSLTKGSRLLNFHTKIHNVTDDHRVRILFPLNIKCDHSFAEEQFGVIQRPNQRETDKFWQKENWTEKPLPLYPMQTFVYVQDEHKGLAFLNRDITEYEILPGELSTLAATLFRSVGAMGRPDLVVRPGRASGLEVATPDALLHGDLEFHYALYPFSDRAEEAAFHANCFNAPLLTSQTGKHPGLEKADDFYIEIEPVALSCTCLKKAEREGALILRIFNSSRNAIANGHLKLGAKFRRVVIANMDEQSISEDGLVINDGVCNLPSIKSNQVITLKMMIG